MLKLFAAVATVALVGFAGFAHAADTSSTDAADGPAELTTTEMDTVTAGAYGSSGFTYTRTINMGSYSLVYDGRTWTRVSN